MAVTTATATAATAAAAASVNININIERMYTAILRENFTKDELEAIAGSKTLQDQLEAVKQQVWRPSVEELMLYVMGDGSDELREQIRYHLEVDKAREATAWVEGYALERLLALIEAGN